MLWGSILAISYYSYLPTTPTSRGNVSSLMTDILFAFSCIVFFSFLFWAQMRSIGQSQHMCTIHLNPLAKSQPKPRPGQLLGFLVSWLLLSSGSLAFYACIVRCAGRFRLLFVHYWPRYTSLLNELLSKWMYACLPT